MQTISHYAALIYVMVIVSASDGAMNDVELRTIGDLTRDLPVFKGFDRDKLIETARDCTAILQEDDGLDAALGLIGEALPDHLRETAYWLALEIAVVDYAVREEEARIVQALRHTLGLERLITSALERGARARFQTA
jgi:tellurite resistance protein